MDNETLKYAKKAEILAQIVTNYTEEKQAVNAKDIGAFRKILQKREELIHLLSAIHLNPPSTPFQRMQHQQLKDLVVKLQNEREASNHFF